MTGIGNVAKRTSVKMLNAMQISLLSGVVRRECQIPVLIREKLTKSSME